MPEHEYNEMRKQDEQIGKILGWKQVSGSIALDDTLWICPGEKYQNNWHQRDDSNELADEQTVDTGLPFYSYSMNGAMRVLNFIAKQDYATRSHFYILLQKRAAFAGIDGDSGQPSWPHVLTTLIPELPKHICAALIETYKEPGLHQRKKHVPGTAPWVHDTPQEYFDYPPESKL